MKRTSTSLSASSHFYTIIFLSVLFAGFIYAYFPVFHSLVKTWSQNDDASHGFLVIPMSIFLVWRVRNTLRETSTAPSSWGLVLILFGLIVYCLAYFAEIKTLASLSFIPVLIGLVIYFYGVKMFAKLSFPIFLLLFMIPVPAQIYTSLTSPLQILVSKISVSLAAMLHVPVYREGNVIYLPELTLQVVRACSGLRSILSILFISTIFGYMTLKSNLLRVLLALSGIPTAVVVNILRLFIIIVAEHYLSIDLTSGPVHIAMGALVFIFSLILIAFLRRIFSNWDRSVT